MENQTIPSHAPGLRKLTPRALAVGALAALSMLGIMMILFAWLMDRQAAGAADTRVPVDLAKLEAGEPLSNINAQLGPHLKIYPHSFFMWNTETGSSGQPVDESEVKQTYTPLVSLNHPFAQAVERLAKQHGGIENIKPKELPPLKNFVVLLRINRFATVGSIPSVVEKSDSVEGLFITHVADLGQSEKDFIKKCLPGVDTDKIMILMEGQYPASALTVWLTVAGGLGLIALGVILVACTKSNRQV